MLTADQAIAIADKSGKKYDVNYEMVINERTPEEALYRCSIPQNEWKIEKKEEENTKK